MVVNSVALETEMILLRYQSQCGGSLTRIAIARAGLIGGEDGRMTGWRSALDLMQWVWVKR